MEKAVETFVETAIENLSISDKKNCYAGCLRMGEDYRVNGKLPYGWRDCEICMPDENNHKCKGYIPCRTFEVVKNLEIESSEKTSLQR